MPETRPRLGPQDAGRFMSLEEFARAEGQPGHAYELARGVVVVIDIPKLPHGLMVDAVRQQLEAYRRDHPGRIVYVGHGSDVALRLPGMQSERHPDLAVYRTPPPEADDPWSVWVPDLVVEVVSEASRKRDHEEKPEDYLRAGVREYWIVDRFRDEVVVRRRRGDVWDESSAAETVVTPLLPDLRLDVRAVLAAGDAFGD